MTTLADVSNVYDKVIRDVFNHDIRESYKHDYKGKIFKVYDTTETTEKFTSMEAMTAPGYTTEGESIALSRKGQGYDSILGAKSYGLGITFTQEMQWEMENNSVKVRDEIMAQKNNVVQHMVRFPEIEAFKMLNNGFATNLYAQSPTPNVPVAPGTIGEVAQLAPDGNPIFGQHVWNSSANGFNNQATQNSTLSSSSILQMRRYASNEILNSEGRKIPMRFNKIIVLRDSAAHDEAVRLFSGHTVPTETADVNILKGSMEVIAVPWIENERAWYACDSTYLNNALRFKWRKKPTMKAPHIDSSNESIRWNAVGAFGFGCVDMPVGWYGSNGSGVA